MVRSAVQVSSLLTQGVLANRFNEETFVAVLARHSRQKQKLLFREIFRLLKRYLRSPLYVFLEFEHHA